MYPFSLLTSYENAIRAGVRCLTLLPLALCPPTLRILQSDHWFTTEGLAFCGVLFIITEVRTGRLLPDAFRVGSIGLGAQTGQSPLRRPTVCEPRVHAGTAGSLFLISDVPVHLLN